MQAIPLTIPTEIKLAGPAVQVKIAREYLEYISLDGKMLQSLHKIVFESPQIFQIDSGNGTTEKSVSYVAAIGGLKLFFIVVRGEYFLPGLLIDGSEIIRTPLFQRTAFSKQPDMNRLVKLIREI